MHATPLSAEVTLVDFSKPNPWCSIWGGAHSILHPPPACNWNERYGAVAFEQGSRADRSDFLSLDYSPYFRARLVLCHGMRPGISIGC
jgi:hypothetical protein